MKVAIVGAEESSWTEWERMEIILMIRMFLNGAKLAHPYTVFISGGCPKGGVDIWAEQIADEFHIPKQIFKPEIEQWEDKYNYDTFSDGIKMIGYKSRNIEIAEACDILYCFSPGSRDYPMKERWNGGAWTANKAQELGKKVVRIVVKA